MIALGRIESVDLRETWSNEATNFTPWLPGNLDFLGHELGMDLERSEGWVDQDLLKFRAVFAGHLLDLVRS